MAEIKFPELPKFPTLFGEKEQARLRELEQLAAKQKEVYQEHFIPTEWEKKPYLERVLRGVVATGYNPPQWFREITPWTEFGLTPEQADKYIRETEKEVRELARKQQVVSRVPVIKDYLTSLALRGLLSGEEAQLYQLIPELDPEAPIYERLELNEAERAWFVNYNKALANMSKEEIADLYTDGFPTPKNLDELMDLINIADLKKLSPDQILSTIAFSKDVEDIREALKQAYPPEVEEPDKAFKDNLLDRVLEEAGISPTGDADADLAAARLAHFQKIADTGIPDVLTIDDPALNQQTVIVSRKEDGIYFNNEKIANINAEGKVEPLPPAEEYIIQSTSMTLGESLKMMFPGISDVAIQAFWKIRSTRGGIAEWYKRYIDPSATDAFNLPVVGVLETLSSHIPAYLFPRDLSLLPVEETLEAWEYPARAFIAGWGNVVAATGGAMKKWLGVGGIADDLTRKGRALSSYMPYVADTSNFRWYQWFNPQNWGSPQWTQASLNLVSGIPFLLGFIAIGIIAYYGAAAAGVAVAGKFALGKFGTTILTKLFGGVLGGTVRRAAESALEAGGTFDDLLEAGYPFEEADAITDEIFRNNMKLVGLDIIETMVAFGKLPAPAKWLAKGINRGLFRVGRVGGKLAITGFTQGGEEYYQLGIQRQALGIEDPWDWDSDMHMAVFLGGMMGIGFGAGGEIVSNIIDTTKKHMTPSQTKVFNEEVKAVKEELIAKGVDKAQAERTAESKALDSLADTKEGEKLIQEVLDVIKEDALNKEIKNPAKRVYNKTITFLENQLTRIDKEIQTYINSYNTHAAKMEGAAPWQKVELQENMKNLEEGIKSLKERKAKITAELEKIRGMRTFAKEGVPVPEDVEAELLREAEVALEKLPPTERDTQGKVKPGLHTVPIPGGYLLIVTNNEGQVAVAAKILDREGTMTLSNIVANEEVATLADKLSVFTHMRQNRIAFPPLEDMSPTALRLVELLEQRANRSFFRPFGEGLTPLEDVEFDTRFSKKALGRIKKALRQFQAVVPINIKRIVYDPRLWSHENTIAGYDEATNEIAFGTLKIEYIAIFHELAHALFTNDTNTERFIIWTEFYGEEVVERLKSLLEIAKRNLPGSGAASAAHWLYKNNPWYQELDENFARCFAEFFMGLETEAGAKYTEALRKLYGKRDLGITLDELYQDVPVKDFILWAYFNLHGVSEADFVYIPSPDPRYQYLLDWIRANPTEAWHQLLNKVIGKDKPLTPESLFRLYELMNLIPKPEKRIKVLPAGMVQKGRELIFPEVILGYLGKAVSPDAFHTVQQLEDGKAVNVEEAEKQTRNLIGAPERTIDISELRQSKIDARKLYEEQLYTANPENPVDVALVIAAKTVDIHAYVEALPSDIEATVTKEFKEAEFDDSPRWNLNFQPVVDAVTVIDFGQFDGLLRRNVFDEGQHAQLAIQNYHGVWGRRIVDLEESLALRRPSWFHPKERAKFDDTVYTVVDNMATEDILRYDEELIERYPDIAEALQDYTEEEKAIVLEYSRNVRLFFDEVIADMNAVRVKLGRDPIEYLEHYLPQVYKANIWGRFLGRKLKQDFLAEKALAPDFVKPDAPFNPHAMEREGGLEGYEKVRNVRKLFMDYVMVAAREMFYTPAIMNAKAHAKVLKEKGLEVPASYVMDWAMRSMVGQPDYATKWRRENIPPFINNPLAFLRARLVPAVLGLNPHWNIFVQASAIALCVLQTGIKNTIVSAVQYLTSQDVRSWVHKNCPSYIIKEGGRGAIRFQDVGDIFLTAKRLDMSPLETVDQIVLYLTNLFELHFTGIACQAGRLRAIELGITDEGKIVKFASDVGGKTQSMYDEMHLPLILSPTVRQIFPFQPFAFEALTRIREMSNIKGLPKAGAYQTVAANSPEGKGLIRLRLKRFLEFAVAIVIINAVGEYFNRRKPWELSSFIPFFNTMMLGIDPNNPWNLPLPARYAHDLWKGFDSLIEHGNWEDLIAWALRYHVPAGSQAWRTLNGIIAVIEGGEKDVEGEIIFEVKNTPEEWLRAVILGVWRTEGGEAWIRRHIKREPPTTRDLVNEILNLEEKLGTSDKGEYYTLNDYGTDVMNLLNKQNIPLWQFTEDPIYPGLTRFRVQCSIIWEDYFKLSEKGRVEYRIKNPYIDATLYFWEKVRTVRTPAAKEELEKIFDIFGVDENPKMHWRGLPVIPEEIKLLPE